MPSLPLHYLKRAFFLISLFNTALVGPAGAVEPVHPHLQAFFSQLNTRPPTATPRGAAPLAGNPQAILLTRDDVSALLAATAADNLTLLRATALFATWVRERNLPAVASGQAVEQAVRIGYALGLTFPLDHMAYMCFAPDRSIGGDFQAHIRVLYTQRYDYPFDKDIFNATVLVRGSPITYDGEKGPATGYLVSSDVHYAGAKAHYTDVGGIQGQKRGVTGFFQKVFFFIPKTLNGLILTGDDLIIDGFIDEKIRGFETIPRYRVIRR